MRPLVLASTSAYRRECCSPSARCRFEVLAPERRPRRSSRTSRPQSARCVWPSPRRRLMALSASGSDRDRQRSGRRASGRADPAQAARMPRGSRDAADGLKRPGGRFFHGLRRHRRAGAQRARRPISTTTTVVFRELSTPMRSSATSSASGPSTVREASRLESLGIALFAGIESTDPTALIGLPLIWVAQALRRCGYRRALARRCGASPCQRLDERGKIGRATGHSR